METTAVALKRIIPITQARRDFFAITDDVRTRRVQYILTEHGRPKVALLPVEDAAMLGGASLAADASCVGYGGVMPRQTAWCVGDGQAAGSPSRRYATREMVKARLSVALLEDYGYPLERLMVGYYVQASDNRYIEADLIAHDGHGQVQAIWMVAAIDAYDARRDAALDDLYALSGVLTAQGQKRLAALVYYSRDLGAGRTGEERVLAIDCRLYPTRQAWESAGSPTLDAMPYCRQLDG